MPVRADRAAAALLGLTACGPRPVPPVEPPRLPWSDAPCDGVDLDSAAFEGAVARFEASDAGAPPEPGGLVLVGSSSIRRWESAARSLSGWGPVQRGFGGATTRDVAAWLQPLVLRHAPAAVLVFAGTNDVAFGVPTDEIVQAWRCVVDQAFSALGPVPIWTVGITPTPARHASWPIAEAVNAEERAWIEQADFLHYVDVPAAFSAYGSPPDASLFVDDGLHLSEAGYALWTETVDAALAALPLRSAPTTGLPAGTLVRVDLGPDDVPAPPVDAFGISWNSWRGAAPGDHVLAGERIADLLSTRGTPTAAALTVSGGFVARGADFGGLTAPDGARLQTLSVPEATQDAFVTDGPDRPGGLTWDGLDPTGRYTLRFFASRADPSPETTTYAVWGEGGPQDASLQISGDGASPSGAPWNDGAVAVLSALQPDAWGRLHVDVIAGPGGLGALSLLEIEAE